MQPLLTAGKGGEAAGKCMRKVLLDSQKPEERVVQRERERGEEEEIHYVHWASKAYEEEQEEIHYVHTASKGL